jgi:hypothetical protein
MKIFSDLKNIDIIDLNYSISYLNHSLPKTNTNFLQKFSNIHSILLFTAKQIIKDLISIVRTKSLKDKSLLFYTSVNQYNSLIPLYKKIENSTFVTDSHKTHIRIPMAFGCLISILLAPRFHSLLNQKYRKEKSLILNRYADYFFIEGMLIWWAFYLKIKKPKMIIFSNDHLVWHRILRKAAESNKIPAIYLQHASVTEKFPKLEFDLSLLEGNDAFNKYNKKGISGKVELVGMIKFDKYHSDVNLQNQVKSIGICTNYFDDEARIEKICSVVSSSFNNLNIFLRPHPSDRRYSFYEKMKAKYNVHLSNSTKENSFEYLKKVDVNIAGETSIHLEAALMNVYPIYFQLQESITDNYGYIKNKLVVDVFDNINEIVVLLNELKNKRPNVRERTKYYVDTVNSEYDGKSTELAKYHIMQTFKFPC